MEYNNNAFAIGALTLVIGLCLGYFVGVNKTPRIEMHRMSDGSMMGGNVMEGTMNGMMMGLEGRTGDSLDLAFLDGMIIHHEGAVEMAEALLKGTKRPELIKLGNDVINAQTEEIRMMKEWRKAWFNQ